ncbi:MAG: YvcK family protein [Bacilli bacterium]|nr:YvcK family protein [Bacilli bacterium]
MKKKVVVFGGGTGLSILLKGLKDFPLDITAIITVSDNGRSTGRLREEFNTPAVGDIRQVISNLSDTDEDIKNMLEYRFKTSSDLNGHAVGNLILTSMLDITGSLKESIRHLSKLLDVRHTVLPLSEDNQITLMATTKDGNVIEGECEITESEGEIDYIFYKEEPKVLPEVIDAIKNTDLILLSMGSLYTSLLPNIICREVLDTIDKTTAPIMYVCNAMTQPGETDHFTVGDHLELINSYLNKRKINAVIASNSKIDKNIAQKYVTEEQKDPVLIDKEKIEKMGVELIESDIFKVEEEKLRHDSIKLATLIMFYLMRD